jgi:hypothetical protein
MNRPSQSQLTQPKKGTRAAARLPEPSRVPDAKSKILTIYGKIDDESRWNISAAKKNCKSCFGRGYQGRTIVRGKRYRLLCRCIPRINLSKKEAG